MPACVRSSSASGSAVLAETASTGTLTSAGGINAAVHVFIFYNGEFASTPVATVKRGADSGFFTLARQTPLGDCSMELWTINPSTETSAAVVVTLPPGSLLTILVYAFEVANYGAQGPAGNSSDASNSATSTTASVTAGATTGGTNNTTVVPAEQNLLVAASGCLSVLGAVSARTGTSDGVLTAGAGTTRLHMCMSYLAATGGSDAMSFIITSIAGPCVELVSAPTGCAINGIIMPNGFLPRVK